MLCHWNISNSNSSIRHQIITVLVMLYLLQLQLQLQGAYKNHRRIRVLRIALASNSSIRYQSITVLVMLYLLQLQLQGAYKNHRRLRVLRTALASNAVIVVRKVILPHFFFNLRKGAPTVECRMCLDKNRFREYARLVEIKAYLEDCKADGCVVCGIQDVILHIYNTTTQLHLANQVVPTDWLPICNRY